MLTSEIKNMSDTEREIKKEHVKNLTIKEKNLESFT